MSNTWTNIWVYGYRTALERFMDTRKIEDEDGNMVLPHGILCVGPVYPHEQDGVDDYANPVYKRKSGAVKCLWLFSLYGDKADLIDELKVLQGPYDIHDFVDYEYEDEDGNVIQAQRPYSVEEMRELYPEMTIGTAIPYIC